MSSNVRSFALGAGLVAAALGVYGLAQVGINTFTAGTAISSKQVNENFANLKQAVEALGNAAPGLAHVAAAPRLALSSGNLLLVQQVTINVPAAGFVQVTAGFEHSLNPSPGSPTAVKCSTNITPGSHGGNPRAVTLPSTVSAADATPYLIPANIVDAYTVQPGARTFFLLCQQNGSGNDFIENATMSVTYFPKNYRQ